MDTTTVKSHQKRHWSVLLNPYLCMDVRLGQFKKTTTKLTGGNRNVVPKENAMNLIYGLQRNQTKVWYQELVYIYAHKYHI